MCHAERHMACSKRFHRRVRCWEADRCAVGQAPLLARRGVRKAKGVRAKHDAEDHQQHRCAAQQHLRGAPAWCEGRVLGPGNRSTAWRRQLRRHSSAHDDVQGDVQGRYHVRPKGAKGSGLHPRSSGKGANLPGKVLSRSPVKVVESSRSRGASAAQGWE